MNNENNLTIDILQKLFKEYFISYEENSDGKYYMIFNLKQEIVIRLNIDGTVNIFYNKIPMYLGKLCSLDKEKYPIPVFVFICILFIKHSSKYLSENTILKYSDLDFFSRCIVNNNFTINSIVDNENILDDDDNIIYIFSDAVNMMTGYFFKRNSRQLFSYKLNIDKVDDLYEYVNNHRNINELSMLYNTDKSILKSYIENETIFVISDLMKYYLIKDSLSFFEIEKVIKDGNKLVKEISKIIQLNLFNE